MLFLTAHASLQIMEDPKRIHKFYGRSGEDFQLWAVRTQAALAAKEIVYTIESDVSAGLDVSAEDRKAVAQACAVLIQGLGYKPLRPCLVDRTNAFKMWKTLSERYSVVNVVTRVQLQTRLAKLSYQGQIMSDFVDSFEEIFNRLAAMNSLIDDSMQVAMSLASFGDRSQSPYGQVIALLQTMGGDLTWETVTSRLLQEFEEKTWLQPGKQNRWRTGHALQVGKGNPRFNRNGRATNKTRFRCFECNEPGHYARNCPQRARTKQYFPSKDGSGEANNAKLLLARNRTGTETRKTFLVDSGASDNMTNNAECLSSLTSIVPRSIVLGNGSTVEAYSEGKLRLSSTVGDGNQQRIVKTVLKRVLYVPELEEAFKKK